MKKKKEFLIRGIIGLVIISILIGSYFMFFYSPYKFTEDRPIKILWINSYHDYPWTDGQIKAFEEVFEKENIEIEVKQFNMDTKNKDSEDEKLYAGSKAKELINSWKPDLIYATDDNAQMYVVADYIDSDIPIVFSGVNREPEFYGFEKSKNVAGVLERYPFSQAIDFMKQLYPHAKKIAVISDAGTSGIGGMDYMKKESLKIDFIDFVAFDLVDTFDEFKIKIEEYQNEADIIIFRGLDTFEKENSGSYSQEITTRWMVENSNIPEISFWDYFVDYGALASITVSSYEQGKAAGEMAKEILIEGKQPSNFDFSSTKKGNQFINIARAKQLNLEIPSTILINSKVVEKFPWEKEEWKIT